MKDGWNVETERLGGLEIDHQLELGRLHDWQIVGFGAAEDFAGIDASLAIGIRQAGSGADQSAGFSELAERIDCRQARTRDRADDILPPASLCLIPDIALWFDGCCYYFRIHSGNCQPNERRFCEHGQRSLPQVQKGAGATTRASGPAVPPAPKGGQKPTGATADVVPNRHCMLERKTGLRLFSPGGSNAALCV